MRALPRRSWSPGLALAVLAMFGCSMEPHPAHAPISEGLSERTVEAACGQCQFELPGDGCDLAVRIQGVPYFVDGTGIDDHGDAHAADGFCNAVRGARVSGNVVDGRFHASAFTLVAE